jgi:hypothetical protein
MNDINIPIDTHFKKVGIRATVLRCTCGNPESHGRNHHGNLLPCPHGKLEHRGLIATSGNLRWERLKDFLYKLIGRT